MVPQFARRHLDAQMVEFRMTTGVEMYDVERNVERLAELFAETFIVVGFVTSQVEIAMNRLQLVTQTVQYPQQAHAIGTSRESHKIGLLRRQELMTGDEIAQFCLERVQHRRILLILRRESIPSDILLQDDRC